MFGRHQPPTLLRAAEAPRASSLLIPSMPELSVELSATLDRCLSEWGLMKLSGKVACCFNPRLRRSLGRCRSAAMSIELNPCLLLEANRSLLMETLCHEAAHVAAPLLYGRRIRAHGPEWRHLLARVGYRPRATIPASEVSGILPRARRRGAVFEYRCLECGRVHLARRRSTRYRCRSCVMAGGEGLLRITRVTEPAPGGASQP